jgi:hypothetical protein
MQTRTLLVVLGLAVACQGGRRLGSTGSDASLPGLGGGNDEPDATAQGGQANGGLDAGGGTANGNPNDADVSDANGIDSPDGSAVPGGAGPAGFSRFLTNHEVIDEEGRYYWQWFGSVNAYSDFDPGPVVDAFHDQIKLMACIVRADGDIDCYTTPQQQPDTDVAPAAKPTPRTQQVVRATQSWEGVTSVEYSLRPAAESDDHLICAATDEGVQCAYAGLSGLSVGWLNSVDTSDARELLRIDYDGITYLADDGTLMRCESNSPGASSGSCWQYRDEGTPDVKFKQYGSSIGINMDGEIVRWGELADAGGTPPSGEFRKLFRYGDATCAITVTDDVECWLTTGEGDLTEVEPLMSMKLRDATGGNQMRIIDGEGRLLNYPALTPLPNPQYPKAIDSCLTTDGTACSEITEYTEATPQAYYELCSAEGGTPQPGSCASRTDANISFVCVGQDFDVEGAALKGFGYFYVGGVSSEQARDACNAARGYPANASAEFGWPRNR